MTAPDYAERARELLEGVVIGLDAPRFSDRIELRRALADRIAHALAQAAEEACGKTEGGYYSHTDALQAVKAWIAGFDGSYTHGWTVPPGIGTVEDIVDRALATREEK